MIKTDEGNTNNTFKTEANDLSLKTFSLPTSLRAIAIAAIGFTGIAQASEKPTTTKTPTATIDSKHLTVAPVLEPLARSEGVIDKKDLDEFFNNQQKYLPALIDFIKNSDPNISAGTGNPQRYLDYNIKYFLAGKISSEEFQLALLERGKAVKSSANREYTYRTLASTVPLSNAVFEYYKEQLKNGAASEVLNALEEVKDPRYQAERFEIIKQFAEGKIGKGDDFDRGKALDIILGQIPNAEEYLISLAKKAPLGTSICSIIQEQGFKSPETVQLLKDLYSKSPEIRILSILSRIDRPDASEALLSLFDKNKPDFYILESLARHENIRAKEIIAGFNFSLKDFSKTDPKNALTFFRSNPKLFNEESKLTALNLQITEYLKEKDAFKRKELYLALVRVANNSKEEHQTFQSYLSSKLPKDNPLQFTLAAVDLGIEHPYRLNHTTLREIVKNRQAPKIEGEKQAVIILTKADEAGAFLKLPEVNNLMNNGYKIIYYEAENEADLKVVINDCKSKKVSAELLILFGHGSRTGISLGGLDQDFETVPTEKEHLYIDQKDLPELIEQGLGSILAKKAQIVAGGCNNNNKPGDNKSPNLTESIQKAFPDHKVWGAEIPFVHMYFSYDETGRVKNIRFLSIEETVKLIDKLK